MTVNGYKHQIFTLNKAAVADALLSADMNLRELWGTPGMGLTCTVNGNLIVLKEKWENQAGFSLMGRR